MFRAQITPNTYCRALSAIVVFGILLRLVLASRALGTIDDPDNYLPLARSLADGRGFSFNGRLTAYRPPLYPIVLTPLVAALGPRVGWGVIALHLSFAVGTILATSVAARRLGLSPAGSLIAAGIVAFDPVLASQSRSVMTEPLAALLIASTLAVLAEGGLRGAWLGGFGFGLSALCRPSLLPAAALSTLGSLVFPPGSARRRLTRAAAVAIATAVPLVPWAWRNQRVFGEPVFTTTHGGYTLALANNPVYYDEVLHGPPGAVWTGPNQSKWVDTITAGARGMPEPQADRYFARQGLRMLRGRPNDFLAASLARLGRFWSLAPSGAVYPRRLRLASVLWTAPLWIALGVGLCCRRTWKWPMAACPLIIIALSAIHCVFWTDLRMRAPIVPAIAIVAAGSGKRWRDGTFEDSTERS